MRRLIGPAVAMTAALAAPLAHAGAPGQRPVVVELFTSEGCSSCPPADAVLRDLARSRPDVLALGFHVTYWDYLGWRDPFSLQAATDRQRDYAVHLRGPVYTPQMVVDGVHDVIGSEREEVLRTIQQSAPSASVPVRLRRDGGSAVIDLGTGAGSARVLLVGYDTEHRTSIGRGENGGRTLLEANIVRAVVPVGTWTGTAASWRAAVPDGERLAVLAQAPDGRILGAAKEDGHAS